MKKLLAIVFLGLTAFYLSAEARNALLIANGKYKSFGSLATPVNEARDLKKSLEKLGFNVSIVENANLEEMDVALLDFQKKLQKGGIGFFHYGGHAVQVKGENYLIPVDANILDENRVRSKAINVCDVMTSMVADANIVILDACRDNPLPASSRSAGTRGLVVVDEKPRNSIIVYSASAGKTAQDGVFTPILTKRILEKKSFRDVLSDVRKDVRKKTNGEQSPGSYDELEESIYLAGYVDQKKNELEEHETFGKNNKISSSLLWDMAGNAYEKNDWESYFSYIQILIDRGDTTAQCKLGDCYANGYGVMQNWSKAVEWYRKAVERGDAVAQFNLGWCYATGNGVEKNKRKAVEFYKKSAEQGYKYAKEALSRIQ